MFIIELILISTSGPTVWTEEVLDSIPVMTNLENIFLQIESGVGVLCTTTGWILLFWYS